MQKCLNPVGFWIKDDGACSEVYGGNKLRKLEYLLPDARERGKRILIVHGDIESHTVSACGLWGRKAGFDVQAVVFPHRLQRTDSPGLEELRELGVRIHLRKTMLGAIMRAHLIGFRRDACVIPLGASTPLTTLAYVNAAVELQEQVAAGRLPQPRRIYIPFATGSSVAGLEIGLRLMGVSTRVVAVQTVEKTIANRRRLNHLIRKTLALLGIEFPRNNRLPADTRGDGFSRDIPGLRRKRFGYRKASSEILIDSRRLGDGYGDVDWKVEEAVNQAAAYGLRLEPIQSGKAFSLLLEDLPRFPEGEILFWNTHDQHDSKGKDCALS